MKHIYRLISTVVISALLMTTKAKAQNPLADPAVITITKQSPSDPAPTGSNIAGSAVLKFRVANNSAGSSANGTIPAGAVTYTVQFNPYYTYESLVPTSQFAVTYASPGSPDYVVQLTNSVPILPGDVFDFYLNVDATQETTNPAGEIVTLNVDRTLPIACGNTSTANDNVAKSFNVVSLITLPVRYIDLTAVLNNDIVNLKWITKDELNVDHFELERSTNGSSFVLLNNRQAVGNTTGQTDYTFLDDIRSLSSATIYYRVKTVDEDGKFYYSKVVMVVLRRSASIFTWPNPFTDNVNLKINAIARSKATIRLYTSNGLLIKQVDATLAAGSNFILVDGLAQLSKQVYVIDVIVDNEKIFSGKLIK